MQNILLLFLTIAAGAAHARPAAVCMDMRDFSIHDFSLKFSDPDAQGVRTAKVGDHIFKEWVENGHLKGSWALGSPSAQCWIYDRAMVTADDPPDQLDDLRVQALGGPWDLRDISRTENFAANFQLFRLFFTLQGSKGELLRQQWVLLHHLGYRLSGLLTLRVIPGSDFDRVQFYLPMRKLGGLEAPSSVWEGLVVTGRIFRTNGRISNWILDESNSTPSVEPPRERVGPMVRPQPESPGTQFFAPPPRSPGYGGGTNTSGGREPEDPIRSLPGRGGTNTSGGR